MVAVAGHRVLRQRPWSEDQLKRSGFFHYQPVKRMVMAKIVSDMTQVAVTLEVLTANSGDVMLYSLDNTPRATIEDYDHWPVKRHIFMQNYARWDAPDWHPNDIESKFLSEGCLPFYRKQGVWALKLPIGIYVQTLESPEPVVVPKGRWLLIGSEGEPYSQSDEDFYQRYQVPANV
ncbi:MAG: hypothetical protein R3E39_26000 [Anaerolineae bacterium]